MLDKVQSRLSIHGISTRQLARDLEVSPSLLSMVLTRDRKPSKQVRHKLNRWLSIPLSEQVLTPAAVYRQFIAEKQSQLAPLTIKFYEAKLRPFALWSEQYPIPDVRDGSVRTQSSTLIKAHNAVCSVNVLSTKLVIPRVSLGAKLTQCPEF